MLKSSSLLNIFAILILFSCQQNQNKMIEPVRVIPMKDFLEILILLIFLYHPMEKKFHLRSLTKTE